MFSSQEVTPCSTVSSLPSVCGWPYSIQRVVSNDKSWKLGKQVAEITTWSGIIFIVKAVVSAFNKLHELFRWYLLHK